jgi:hypothetical protein
VMSIVGQGNSPVYSFFLFSFLLLQAAFAWE